VSASAPTVSGTIASRNTAREAFDAASVPAPAIGTVRFAIVRSRFVSIVIGLWTRPLASALRSSSAIALRTDGASTFGAFTTTFAGSALPGNACCMRS